MSASEVKIYKISGKYVKLHQRFQFTKYVRALDPEDALEKVLCLVTSQHILRRKIKIIENKEITVEECPDLYIQELVKM